MPTHTVFIPKKEIRIIGLACLQPVGTLILGFIQVLRKSVAVLSRKFLFPTHQLLFGLAGHGSLVSDTDADGTLLCLDVTFKAVN